MSDARGPRWGLGNSTRPAAGTWLARLFARPHPDAFTAGVRVVSGDVPGEGARWRFRPAAVDPYRPGGVVALSRDGGALRLREVTVRDDAPPRPGHQVLAAVVADTGAQVLLSVPLGDVARFGVDPA